MVSTPNPFEMTDMQIQEAQKKVEAQAEQPAVVEVEQPAGMEAEPINNPVVDQNNEMGVTVSTEPVAELPPVVDTAPVGQPVFQKSQQPAIVTGPPLTMKDALLGAAQEVVNTPQEVVNTPIQQPIQPAPQQAVTMPPQMTAQPMAEQSQPIPESTQPTQSFNNYSNDHDKLKYKIFDLYWLWPDGVMNVNPLSIGYNIDYDNLRFSFYNAAADTFDETSAELNGMAKQCVFNMFTEIAEQVLYIFDNPTWQVRNYERVFQRSDNWAPCVSGFSKDVNGVHIHCKCNDNPFKFTLTGWQIIAFRKSLEFAVSDARLLKISKFQS